MAGIYTEAGFVPVFYKQFMIIIFLSRMLGWIDSIAGKELSLHTANTSCIPGTAYGPPTLL